MNAEVARVASGPNIGRALVILFLVKPFADLFWAYRGTLVGIDVTAGHVVGLFVLMYFGLLLFRFPRERPYGSTLLITFIILNMLSVMVGLFYNDQLKFSSVIDIFVRLLDSYVVFIAAYIGVVRGTIKNPVAIFATIAIASSLVVVINIIAIKSGFGGIKVGAASVYSSLRERGLYYDPGVLSNVAISGFLFCVYVIHMIKRRKNLVRGLCIGVMLCCLYLIGLSLSRAAMVEIGIFAVIYIFTYQRLWGRILAPMAFLLVVIVAPTFLSIDYDSLFVRFQHDLEVLQSLRNDLVAVDSGEVSFGEYEKLGNNRIANWAYALTQIGKRSWLEIVFGNFRSTTAHSDYVDVLGRNGIIGLFLYLLILWRLSNKCGKLMLKSRDNPHRMLYFAAFSQLVLYIFYAIPFRPLLYTTSAWYMWFSIGISMGYAQLTIRERKKQKKMIKPESTMNTSSSAHSRKYHSTA